MTQHKRENIEIRHTSSIQRMLRAVCIASAFCGVVALTHDAQAGQQCTSKPAVCALNKSKASQQAQKASQPAEVKKVVRVKRCTSKPAVCALQRATAPQTVVATEVVREKPAVKRCTSKPAVCALQRSQAAAKNQK